MEEKINNISELCELFFKYKSDKCPKIYHSYSPEYYKILNPYKNNFKYVLEIGVGTNEIMKPISGVDYQVGSSLRAWRDFFPNALVFGLDINKKVLFEDQRLKCFYTDQSNTNSLEETIININSYVGENIMYDFILDDGSHLVDHMILTFHTLKKYLKKDGIYIIEDIKLSDLNFFKTLESNELEIIYIHKGVSSWDSFIAFKKK